MNTSESTAKKTRTITLTDRPPVRIVEDDWPVIAEAKWYEGQIEAQANRSGWIKARQHIDGRSLVYGAYATCWQNESDRRGGELLAAGADIAAAIRRVGEDLSVEDYAIRACIADLPAEEI